MRARQSGPIRSVPWPGKPERAIDKRSERC
jgi:hypothetical protein